MVVVTLLLLLSLLSLLAAAVVLMLGLDLELRLALLLVSGLEPAAKALAVAALFWGSVLAPSLVLRASVAPFSAASSLRAELPLLLWLCGRGRVCVFL